MDEPPLGPPPIETTVLLLGDSDVGKSTFLSKLTRPTPSNQTVAPNLQTTFQYELPILLLALKRDLRSEQDPNGIIYPQEGHRVAQELRCDRYMECSSQNGELVAEVWRTLVETAVLAAGGGKSGF
ncbi:hypothetical protein DID88_000565 [Monilinia fructigena]|uniref:P-loop containing nucleoside triphosphate hydrolase protein n=1 Tax=Monilinia fructigena TaxID=38457 RepID=A0A395INH7_9HELO|nr:hypothetical protein DID88_000565 [Monilinia fructigena]